MAVSPDGDEMFYSVRGPSFPVIVTVKRLNGRWVPPAVASFSGRYADLEPCFSADGRRLYFVSARPPDGQSEPKDYDIWYVDRSGDGWGKPINPGAPLNSDKNEFYPSLTADDRLVFCAAYEGGLGGEDLYVSRLADGAWSPPENLGANVNTAADEYNPFISSDGSFIIFTSHGWGAGQGGGDLWICFADGNGTWRQAVNMGAKVNSPAFEYCPRVTHDGRYLFFTSNRTMLPAFQPVPLTYQELQGRLSEAGNGGQDLYWMTAGVIEELRAAVLQPEE
jgi:Tol biopolymer transport system component